MKHTDMYVDISSHYTNKLKVSNTQITHGYKKFMLYKRHLNFDIITSYKECSNFLHQIILWIFGFDDFWLVEFRHLFLPNEWWDSLHIMVTSEVYHIYHHIASWYENLFFHLTTIFTKRALQITKFVKCNTMN